MCKFIKNNKYHILLILLIIILIICIHIILINLQNETIAKPDIVNSFSSFFIGIISIIGIIFNLRDNEKLRIETKEMKQNEINYLNNKNENVKLLISHEVFENLSVLKDYNSKINMKDETSILMKPMCFNTAWNSLYKNLPEVFKKEELILLIKFYEEIMLLLDDSSWLEFNNGESEGAFKKVHMRVRVFTEYDLKEISLHKKFIKEHVENILSLESDLKFLK